VKLKKFNEYTLSYSKDPKNFEKKIALACSENLNNQVFQLVNSTFESEITELPIIRWNTKFNINESSSFFYNKSSFPTFEEICDSFSNESFIPRTISNRDGVKRLKFPIIGITKDSSEEFKTYGKFKKSEKNFSKFREKVTPQTRYDVIAFKSEPLHLQERINHIGFDANLSNFKHLDQVNSIIEKVNQRYPVDFYHCSLIESDGRLYLEAVGTSLSLSPSQSVKMYEKAYENFYEFSLPNWFKNQLFENHIKPYYRSRYYDALLIKPKSAINFKKYID